ncbi:formyltransferase family protein [Trinickia sp. NRRL B-1857]|uniref:phosphoribosylglycinamide formyltransferase n=1 Tax=Trinickia sp. NRRL B-1857 TaxID=3162879 RepID=UPI003D27AF16
MTRRIVFLCSGGGGNLRFIARAAELGTLPDATIAAVLTDRECLANQFAREQGLPTEVLDFGGERQQAVVTALEALAPDVVVTNVHKILSPAVIEAARGRLINLHYSLLPAYGGVIGTRPVELALANGAKFIGVTAHEVDVAVDAGRPIIQAVLPTEPADTVASVMDTIFRCGCLVLLEALRAPGESPSRAPARLCIHGREVFINPALSFSVSAFDEPFWQALAAYPASPVTGSMRS